MFIKRTHQKVSQDSFPPASPENVQCPTVDAPGAVAGTGADKWTSTPAYAAAQQTHNIPATAECQ